MEATANKNLKGKERTDLKMRVLNCQPLLPSNYGEIITELFPEYDRIKVRNVRNTSVVDERLTLIFESLSSKFTAMKKAVYEEIKAAEAEPAA